MSVLYDRSLGNVSVFHSLDEHPQKRDFSMHIHAQNEIFIFVSGKATYLVEGNEYPLSPGSMLFIREAETHAINFIADEPYERYVINFSPSLIADIDPERRLLSPFYDRPLGVGNLYEPSDLAGASPISYLKSMCAPSTSEAESRVAIISYLLPLLCDASRAFEAKRQAEDGTRQDILSSRIIAFVNEHLLTPITVPDVARHFYMSVSQLERIFKRATHSSVWHYITVKRLAAARARIESGVAATTASAECGFGDYSSFYRAYIKEYGEPPNIHKRAKTQ